MNRTLFVIVLCLFVNQVFSQKLAAYSNLKKGQLYVMWGWNRAAYTKSNISFKGSDYDFKLYKVKAHDRPTGNVSYHNYLQLDRLTIPQTNFRIGYFVKKNLALSFGFDHMKYVMDQYQTVEMKGVITQEGPYKGTYNGPKMITPDFLKYEHTDGLNYINVEAEKYINLYHASSNKCIVDVVVGAGAGVLMPRTDVTLLNYERNDEFHIAGFGLSSKAGIQGTFFKHLVVKIENKYGYINMPDVNLHKKGIPGQAKQAFFFTALDGMIGGTFSLNHKKKKSK
jgi:hypothetical protein